MVGLTTLTLITRLHSVLSHFGVTLYFSKSCLAATFYNASSSDFVCTSMSEGLLVLREDWSAIQEILWLVDHLMRICHLMLFENCERCHLWRRHIANIAQPALSIQSQGKHSSYFSIYIRHLSAFRGVSSWVMHILTFMRNAEAEGGAYKLCFDLLVNHKV